MRVVDRPGRRRKDRTGGEGQAAELFRLRRKRRCRFPVFPVIVSLPSLPRRQTDTPSVSRFPLPLPLPPLLENQVT